jgi:tetratricopeptide (TPR) repeat protein
MIKMIKKFYKECKSAYYHGVAFKKMELGKYEKAACILESLIQTNPNGTNIEYSYYRLGRCYFMLGNLETALLNLSKSDELYRENIKTIKNDRYSNAYQEMIHLYRKVRKINNSKTESEKKGEHSNKIGS